MRHSLTTMAIGQAVIVLFLSGCGRGPSEAPPNAACRRSAPRHKAEIEWAWSMSSGSATICERLPADVWTWSHSGEEDGPYELTCCLLKSQGLCNIYALILTVPQKDKEPLILSQLVNYQGRPLTVFDCHGQTVVIRPGSGLASRKTKAGNGG